MTILRVCMLYIVMMFWGCSESLLPIEEDTVKPKEWAPEIIWKKQHGPEKFDQLAFRIELFKNNLIAGYQSSQGNGYWIYDKKTGNVLNDIKVEDSFLDDPSTKLIDKTYSAAIKMRQIRLIDLETMQVKTSQELGLWGSARVVYQDNYFYMGTNSFDPVNRISFGRIRIDHFDQPWEIFLQDDWPLNVPQPRSTHAFCEGVKLNEKGEHILFFGNSQYYTDTFPTERIKYQAYNVDLKKMLWQTEVKRKKELYPEGGGGPHVPYFFEDNVIMFSTGYIRSFNQKTGKLSWERNLEQISTTDYKVIGQFLYIATNLGILHQIDLVTGASLRTLDLKTGNTGAFQEHNGILYFTMVGNKLYAIDAAKMEIKWEWKSPNNSICGYCSFGSNSPVVDKETNQLYITDGRDMFCIKLPE
jgi:outer membrane protein assembly factor BamB